MDNNIKTIDTLLDHKLSRYGSNDNDFVAVKELTVTITLNEYRQLISAKATKEQDIDKIRSEKWKVQEELNEANKKIERLCTQLYEKEEENNND